MCGRLYEPTLMQNQQLYYRLIALWVLCEAMLGGIIHGFHIPVSGLLVGSGAIICISLIAWYKPERGAIIKATLIVAIFKMMITPYAPVPAYFAVFFQGVLGELVFFNRRFFRTACVVLAVLSMLESGLQRILMLTIVYGNDLWKAINGFVNNLTGQTDMINYSLFIIGWYVLLHILMGFIVGIWIGVLPSQIKNLETLQQQFPVLPVTGTDQAALATKKSRNPRLILFIIWILLLLLYVQSFFHIGRPLLPTHIPLRIFIRSVIIILTWFFAVGPLLRYALNKWLQQKQRRWQQDIKQVVNLLPAMQQIVTQSWSMAGGKKGWGRYKLFTRIILANTFFGYAA